MEVKLNAGRANSFFSIKKKDTRYKMFRGLHILIFCLLFFASFPSSAAQIPIPLGIDGTVYGLDGVSRAGSNVMISLRNPSSGYYVEGRLRKDGSYSAAVIGSPGDIVYLKAWTPYNEAELSIAVTGVMHGFDILLNLSMPNQPPFIHSSPASIAYEGRLYSYIIDADDPNNDELAYYLLEGPFGLSIENKTGIISWIPRQENIGMNFVSIKVSDGEFDAFQDFEIEVIGINDPPSFVSLPVTDGEAGKLYEYISAAEDPDSENLTFFLLTSPQGMAISPNTGIIRWTPTSAQAGNHNITIGVTDGELEDIQSFLLVITNYPNQDPVITSLPVSSSYEDSIYLYDVEAYDPEGGVLSYSLVFSPDRMSVDKDTGAVSWFPGDSDVGTHKVIIKVSDPEGGSSIQEYSLSIIGVNDPPQIISSPITSARIWSLYTYTLIGSDPENDSLSFFLQEKPSFMYINKNSGMIFWIPYKTGRFKVVARVYDGQLSALQEFYIDVGLTSSKTSFAGLSYSKDGMNVLDVKNMETDVLSVSYAILGESGSESYLAVISSNETPEVAKKPASRFTYKYLSLYDPGIIETGERREADGKILFRVENKWLEQYAPDSTKLTLVYYDNENEVWVPMATQQLYKDALHGYFESNISGFGDFAIVPEMSAEEMQEQMTEDFKSKNKRQPVRRPHAVTGKIFFADNSPVPEGIQYKIINKNTSEIFEGNMKEGMNAYAHLVSGDVGDILEISAGEGTYEGKSSVSLTGAVVRADIQIGSTKEEYEKIKRDISLRRYLSLASYTLFAAVVIALAGAFIYKGARKRTIK